MHVVIAMISAIAPFVSTVVSDPIEGTEFVAFGTANDDLTLLLGCPKGSNSLTIRVTPERYYGAQQPFLLWEPSADSRFSQSKPMRSHWRFDQKGLEFDDLLGGGNERKAKFIDQLVRDNSFSIRYEAVRGQVETLTINYSIDATELAGFLGKCDPKRVNQYLREWGSPAAPK